jgi:hypothetical protein
MMRTVLTPQSTSSKGAHTVLRKRTRQMFDRPFFEKEAQHDGWEGDAPSANNEVLTIPKELPDTQHQARVAPIRRRRRDEEHTPTEGLLKAQRQPERTNPTFVETLIIP